MSTMSIKQVKAILSEAGVELDKITTTAEKICELHKIDMDSIKEERDSYKAQAEKATDAETKLTEASAKLKEYESKAKETEKELEELHKLRDDITAEKLTTAKTSALKKLLTEQGYGEKWHNRIIKSVDLNTVELNKDESIKGVDKLLEAIGGEWADTKETIVEVPYKTPNPPVNTNSKSFSTMSLADKMAYAEQHPTDTQVTEWLKNPTLNKEEK